MAMRKAAMSLEEAEALAMSALQFLACEPERIGRFLALSGLGPADIRAGAETPDFQQAVLAHLLEDESALLVFATQAGVKPEKIAEAERLLGRGQ
jgi:hypothetical protein